MNEASRELDVTPYYAAFVSGNNVRGQKVAEYARSVLIDRGIFPMPLFYPFYGRSFNPAYPADGFVPGGCWEESYYNCVRAWAKYGMCDAVYAAVKRRSDAHLRDKDCREWYTPDGTNKRHFPSRDRYGITAAAHVSAVIEGLFGITPAGFGFDEINVWPAIPPDWADKPATISVTLPGGGFLTYSYLFRKEASTVALTVETDKERRGHFRIAVPGKAESIAWNARPAAVNVVGQAAGLGDIIRLDGPFLKATIEIKLRPQ